MHYEPAVESTAEIVPFSATSPAWKFATAPSSRSHLALIQAAPTTISAVECRAAALEIAEDKAEPPVISHDSVTVAPEVGVTVHIPTPSISLFSVATNDNQSSGLFETSSLPYRR